MKRIFRCFLLFVLCLFLCACGGKPYLSAEEQHKIASGLLGSLVYHPGVGTVTMEVRNDSSYDLYDVSFHVDDSDSLMGSVPYLPAKGAARVGSYPEIVSDDLRLYVRYTIGAFTYFSEETESLHLAEDTRDKAADAGISISVQTAGGPVQLMNGETVRFNTAEDFPQLTDHIYTALMDMSEYDLVVTLTGRANDTRNSVCVKLYNEENVIYCSDFLYWRGTGESHVYLGELPKGAYTLVMEQ